MSLVLSTLSFCPLGKVSSETSQMMGKSESGLAEPHDQEHLAILALRRAVL